MALTEPRRSTFEIRELALARAIELHLKMNGSRVDHVLGTAKEFEGYLAGPAPTARVEGDSTTKGSYALPALDVDPEVEQWRMGVEALPYDGEAKNGALDEHQLAYRIEVLARIVLEDVNEDPTTRQAALDELIGTAAMLPDFIADGAE